jgi:isopenicillin N synthase-like dioxygenase
MTKSCAFFIYFFLILSNSAFGANIYYMKTAQIVDEELVFESKEDFDEVLRVGFFRIKRPQDIQIEISRRFAREFNNISKYKNFGSKDPVNGYILSELSQAIRFTLERDHWDKKAWASKIEKIDPNYPPEIQKIGHQLKNVGLTVFKSILKKYDIPQNLWFKASAGCIENEGSYYLNFNYYDPKISGTSYGLGAHKDWSYITILDVVEEGLEAEIDGVWRPLHLEEGYLTINFGEPLQKLLSGVNACNHRVVTQDKKPRTSTVMFIDPRVGPYRISSVIDGVGMVWDWDPKKHELTNGVTTTEYFSKLSQELYGKTNSQKQ